MEADLEVILNLSLKLLKVKKIAQYILIHIKYFAKTKIYILISLFLFVYCFILPIIELFIQANTGYFHLQNTLFLMVPVRDDQKRTLRYER